MFSLLPLFGDSLPEDTYDYDIVLTPDASGSMSGRKNQDSKNAQLKFLDSLPLDRCRVGVVIFSGNRAKLVKRLTPNHRAVKSAIDRIVATGTTPFYDGLEKSYHQLGRGFRYTLWDRLLGRPRPNPGSSKVIVISSDGHNNTGPGEQEILSLGDRIKTDGVRIVTIAIGREADRTLLKRLASSPGDFHIADYSGQLEDVYQKVASDITPVQ